MSEASTRYNTGKIEWSQVHFKSLEPMVRVLEFGARKYAKSNWQKGLNKISILESMMRHLTALLDGEENDPESGLPHIGHIMCNGMFYEYFNLHPEKEVPYGSEAKTAPIEEIIKSNNNESRQQATGSSGHEFTGRGDY